MSTPDEPQSKLRRWPSKARVAPLPVLRQTVPSGRVRAVISPPAATAGPRGGCGRDAGRRGTWRERGATAAEGPSPRCLRHRAAAQPHLAAGERHPRGVLGGAAALGGVGHRVETRLPGDHRDEIGTGGLRAPAIHEEGRPSPPELLQAPREARLHEALRSRGSPAWPRGPRPAGSTPARGLGRRERRLARQGRRGGQEREQDQETRASLIHDPKSSPSGAAARLTLRASGRLGSSPDPREKAITNSRSSSGGSSGGIGSSWASWGGGGSSVPRRRAARRAARRFQGRRFMEKSSGPPK